MLFNCQKEVLELLAYSCLLLGILESFVLISGQEEPNFRNKTSLYGLFTSSRAE